MEDNIQFDQLDMSPKAAFALHAYITFILTIHGPALQRFLEAIAREFEMGWRSGVGPENKRKLVTIENVAKRTDISGHPMFESEVEQFVGVMRYLYKYPYGQVKDAMAHDEPVESQLMQEELLLFCIWLDKQTPGAGKTLYAGPLEVGKGPL